MTMSLPTSGTLLIVLPFLGSILAILLFAILFVRRYRNPYESELSTIITSITSMTIALITCALTPIDIFIVSLMKDSNGDFKEWATNSTQREGIENAVLYSYYTLYSLIFFCIFILIPFMYFFYEEKNEDGFSSEGRFCNAFKYSLVFLFTAVVLLLLGAFVPLRESSNDNRNSTNSTNWINDLDYLINDLKRNRGEDALSMVLSILTSLGVINLVIFTGFGMSSWPIGLIRGTKSARLQIEEIQDSHLINQTKINALRDRERIGSRLTARERRQLAKLEETERVITREEHHLLYYRSSLFYKCRQLIRPLQIVFGFLACGLSLLIWISLLMANIDKAMHSLGMRMGYALPESHLPNPIDLTLVAFQRVFPLDYVLILIMTYFFIMATISGLRNLGIWFFIIKLYKLRPKKTSPQALLMLFATLMLTVLGINILFYCVSPQYTTYGSQHYISNGTLLSCSTKATTDECVMTRASALLVRFFYKAWFFGAFYYWSMWAFIAVSAVSCLYVILRPSRSVTDGLIDEDDLEESDDEPIRP